MRRQIVRSSSWLALSLLLVGCATQLPVRRVGWHYEHSVASLLTLAVADFYDLKDVRVEARVAYTQSGQRERGTAGLLYLPPDLFRVEVFGGPFSSPVFTALLERDSLTVVSGDQQWKEPGGARALTGLVELDLGDYDPVFALLGMIEPLPEAAPISTTHPRADILVASVVEADRSRRLWIDRHRGFVTREELRFPGRERLVRELADYRLVGGAYLPHRVEISQGGASLLLLYRDFKVNSGFTSDKLIRGMP